MFKQEDFEQTEEQIREILSLKTSKNDLVIWSAPFDKDRIHSDQETIYDGKTNIDSIIKYLKEQRSWGTRIVQLKIKDKTLVQK
jgi:hypothetical protein